MKRFLVFILCLLTLGIDAAPGCIGRRAPYGELGPVECDICPCTSIGEGGSCPRCGHAGPITRGRSAEQANHYEVRDYTDGEVFYKLAHRRI